MKGAASLKRLYVLWMAIAIVILSACKDPSAEPAYKAISEAALGKNEVFSEKPLCTMQYQDILFFLGEPVNETVVDIPVAR